jgi:protein gp37
MGSKTEIAWTDSTVNIVTGCTKVSAGCRDCYAKLLHDRRHKAYLEGKKLPEQYSTPFEVVRLHPERLRIPLSWKRGRKIFICSTSDLFHEDVPFEFILKFYNIAIEAQQHTFQILTKRPERALEFYKWAHREYFANIWFGVSIENQVEAERRLPCLAKIPAAVKFISAEPLLGALHITPFIGHTLHHCSCGWHETEMKLFPQGRNWLCPTCKQYTENYIGVSWVIVGGESGNYARPMAVEWAAEIRNQCKEAGTAFFMKQFSQLDHPKTFRDFNKFPAHLQLREFPTADDDE